MELKHAFIYYSLLIRYKVNYLSVILSYSERGVSRCKGINSLTNTDNPGSSDVIGPIKDPQSLPSTVLLVLAWSKFSWFSVYQDFTMGEYHVESSFPESDDPSSYVLAMSSVT